MKQPKHVVLWFLIVASLVLSLRVLAVRVPLEENNRNVEIALEYGDLVKIADMVSVDPLEMVKQAQGWGMTSLVLLDRDLMQVDDELLQHARNSGLLLTPQLSNTLAEQGYTDLNEVLTAVYTLPNFSMLFFSGYEVYGYGDDVLMSTIAQIIHMRAGTLGMVEFLGEQKGLETYLGAAQAKVIRIHPGYPYDTREELLLAVTDRNVRMIFLKPFKHMDMTPGKELASLQQWIEQTAQDVQREGFALAAAKPLLGLPLSFSLVLYLSIGIFAALALLASVWFPQIGTPLWLITTLLGALGSGLIYMYGFLPTIDLVDALSLLAAIVFPSLGLSVLMQQLTPQQSRHQRQRLAVVGFVGASLLTLTGGTIVNALRSETVYLNAIFAFRGVKVAYFLPLVLTVAYALLRSPYRLNKAVFTQKWSRKQWVMGVSLFALLGYYVVRSGNETGAVSGLERQLRQFLQDTLGVRPRFKEFLSGYPALALVPFFASVPAVAVALLFLSTAGQVSIFNTFMHGHTPYMLSFSRVIWGFALGIPLAFVVYVFTKRYQPNPVNASEVTEGELRDEQQ